MALPYATVDQVKKIVSESSGGSEASFPEIDFGILPLDTAQSTETTYIFTRATTDAENTEIVNLNGGFFIAKYGLAMGEENQSIQHSLMINLNTSESGSAVGGGNYDYYQTSIDGTTLYIGVLDIGFASGTSTITKEITFMMSITNLA